MKNSHGRYILAAEVATPMGINLDLSLALAKADLGRFNQQVAENGIDKYTYANIDFIDGEDVFSRSQALVSLLLNALLKPLNRSLKPIPLILSVPSSVSLVKLQQWLEESDFSKSISNIEVVHQSGPKHLETSLKALDKYDALISICLDSPVQMLDKLIEQKQVLSSNNPWGIIPSEGGAGMVLARKNIVETLKLKPIARFGHFNAEYEVKDRRAMMRLIKTLDHSRSFGWLYSDMTNRRQDTEDYGFALGARAEKFINAQQPFLINELWGSLGQSSAMALIAAAIFEHKSHELATLLMFSITGDRAVLQLETEFDADSRK